MAKKKSENAPEAKAPTTPETASAWAALERGDARSARREAKAVLEGSAPEAAKAEARDILRRTALDPGVVVTLVVMALVLAAIILTLSHRS